MNRHIHIIFCFVLCFFYSVVDGQNPEFRHYTPVEGLPSSETYCVTQDKDGFIWVATDNGICMFDGIEFKDYPLKKFSNNIIVSLLGDASGRLWMTTILGEVLYYKNDKVHVFDTINVLQHELHLDLYEDSQRNIWYSTSKEKTICVTPSDSMIEYTSNSMEFKKFMEWKGGVYSLGDTGILKIKDGRITHDSYNGKPLGKTISLRNQITVDSGLIGHNGDRLLFYDPLKRTLQPIFEEYKHLFNQHITWLYKDRKGNIWILTRHGVLYFYWDKQNKLQVKNYLEGTDVSVIFEDDNDNFWFTTRRDGLFFLSSSNLPHFKDELSGHAVTSLEVISNTEFLVSYSNASIDIVNPIDWTVKKLKKLEPIYQPIYDICVDEEQKLWVATNRGLIEYDASGEWVQKHVVSSTKCVVEGFDDEIWYGTSTNARFLNKKNGEIPIFKMFKDKYYAILAISSSKAWLGGTQGLAVYDYSTKTYERIVPKINVKAIEKDKDGTLWVGTKGDGLFYSKNGKDFKKFKGKLASDICNAVFIDENNIWVGTPNGLNQINKKDTADISLYNRENGLCSNEITSIVRLDTSMIIGTTNGINVIHDSWRNNPEKPRLQITAIIAGKDTLYGDKIHLNKSQRDLIINFKGLYYKFPIAIEYRHKMLGRDQDWVETVYPSVRYSAMSAGKYTLRVQARRKNTKWSSSKEIYFTVEPKFNETILYTIIIIIGSVFLTSIVAYVIYGYNQRRNQLFRDLREHQLMALRARMNPHFIFNALGSIQDFFIRNDKRSANRYLGNFAKLMRNTLNVSDQTSTSLKKELETLELYLSLEAMRWGGNLDYQFEIDEDIDRVTTMIPTMLIQPFVENSIKHGLLHKTVGEKRIIIRFYLKNNILMAEIEDNGVGRKKSKEIQLANPRSHQSVGMKVSRERLKLINKTVGNKLNVRIIDLMDSQEKAAGTKVVLQIYL